jgi:competence protein ComEC
MPRLVPSALPFALLGFAGGVLALQAQAELPPAGGGIASAAAALGVAWLTGRVPRARAIVAIAVALGAAAAGFGYASWRAQARLADELPHEWEGVDIDIVGVIDDLPQRGPRGTRFAFARERVETPDAIVPSRLSLVWYDSIRRDSTERAPSLKAGERWRFTVRLKRPHGDVNPHGFDVEAWLLEQKLRATGYVRPDGDNARIDAFAGPSIDYVQRAREAIRARIVGALANEKYAGVIVALAIGDQRAIPEAQWRVFNRTGITHLISISGLHVTVFATLAGAIAFALARRSVRLTARIPAHKIAAATGAAAAFGYVLLAGAEVPAQRTLLMLAVAAFGVWLARPGTAAIVWLWALAVVLAWDPWAGLAAGFWLSFGAVALLLYGSMGRRRMREATWRARLGAALREAAHAQALVTIGLVPMTLAIFQQVSIVSPIANALAIPAVTFVVVPLTLAGAALPFDLPFVLAHAAFSALMMPLDALAGAPGAVWQQHAPPTWTIVAALAGVGCLAAPRGVPAKSLGALWLAPLALVRPQPPPDGAFDLSVLDVGQGLAVVVATHAHALLYDAGPRYNDDADAGGRVIAPYLRAAGVARLDAIVISHQDSDHSGGARTLLQTVPVDWVASSLPYDNPIVALRSGEGADPLAHVRCEQGQTWTWDGVRFTVLQPTPMHYRNPTPKANDLSCVVRIDSAYGSALLTGDLEARGEAELVRQNAPLAADVLVVPHHGSRTSSTVEFIAAVAPDVAIFTPGYRNRFGHPRPDVVERYALWGSALYRTDYDGAVMFRFAPGFSREPRVERLASRRYWREAPVRDAAPLVDEPIMPQRPLQ